MTEVSIIITLADGNLILGGLAERPFKQVFELIGCLNCQAGMAFPPGSTPETTGAFRFTVAQMRLITEVLGEMPFNRVQRLLQQLHGQINEQSSQPSQLYSEAQADAG